MLAENHSTVRANTWFADVEKSVKFPLEIITLVSSAKNIVSAREFICNERLFILTKNSRGPRMGPWGLRASIFPSQKLNYELNWVILFLPSVFYLFDRTLMPWMFDVLHKE